MLGAPGAIHSSACPHHLLLQRWVFLPLLLLLLLLLLLWRRKLVLVHSHRWLLIHVLVHAWVARISAIQTRMPHRPGLFWAAVMAKGAAWLCHVLIALLKRHSLVSIAITCRIAPVIDA